MTISQVSEKYAITAATLRYYERIGLLPQVHRSSGGIRDYDEDDLKRVEFVKCMRSAGLPIEALIEYIKLYMQSDSTEAARLAILQEQRGLLVERIHALNDTLAVLDRKIALYHSALTDCEGGGKSCAKCRQQVTCTRCRIKVKQEKVKYELKVYLFHSDNGILWRGSARQSCR